MNASAYSLAPASSPASGSDLLSARQFGCFLLEHCGPQHGDRVAIQLPNINQYLIALCELLCDR